VAVWASFGGIIATLNKEVESEDSKTRVKAKNLLAAVKCFEFIVALMFMKNVMSKTKILTKQVQAIELLVLGCKRFTEKSSCKCSMPKYYCFKIT
jgi:hypothetical protein